MVTELETQARASAGYMVESQAVGEGNMAYVHVMDASKLLEITETLKATGQEIVTEATIGDRPVLVTRGAQSRDALLQALQQKEGVSVEWQEAQGRKFNPWGIRGYLSIVGQFLTLFSASKTEKGIDSSTLGFATLNLGANATNILFGAEKPRDIHQEFYLKTALTKVLEKHIAEGETLPQPELGVDATQRAAEQAPQSAGQRAQAFMEKNSVKLGEIGLRYLGAISLAFPFVKNKTDENGQTLYNEVSVTGPDGAVIEEQSKRKPVKTSEQWGEAAGKLVRGDVKGAVENVINDKAANRKAGLLYLAGKTVALFSKTPDPYNPEPSTPIDWIRENVTFRLASVIEFFAAATLAHDRFTNPDRKIVINGQKMQDYVGGVGATLFTIGQAVRFFAPFGVKQVDMDALDEFIVDGLAKVPQEKLPQVVAETAAMLTEHFKGKFAFGEIYAQLSQDLYKQHRIAVPDSEESLAVAQALSKGVNPDLALQQRRDDAPAIAPEPNAQDTGIIQGVDGKSVQPAL